jgi:hypothetical protein
VRPRKFSGVVSCGGAFVERAIFFRDPLHRTGADTALARRLENALTGAQMSLFVGRYTDVDRNPFVHPNLPMELNRSSDLYELATMSKAGVPPRSSTAFKYSITPALSACDAISKS